MSGAHRESDEKRTHWVTLGHLSGVHGVRGSIKVYSWTRPREAILDYPRWFLGPDRIEFEVLGGRTSGRSLIVELAGVDDRGRAESLVRQEVAVPRASLPETAPGEYYWSDLEGLEVLNREGQRLGRVRKLLETGAHDVLVLEGEKERLIPFVQGEFVHDVDLDAGRIIVDWDPNWDEGS